MVGGKWFRMCWLLGCGGVVEWFVTGFWEGGLFGRNRFVYGANISHGERWSLRNLLNPSPKSAIPQKGQPDLSPVHFFRNGILWGFWGVLACFCGTGVDGLRFCVGSGGSEPGQLGR